MICDITVEHILALILGQIIGMTVIFMAWQCVKKYL